MSHSTDQIGELQKAIAMLESSNAALKAELESEYAAYIDENVALIAEKRALIEHLEERMRRGLVD